MEHAKSCKQVCIRFQNHNCMPKDIKVNKKLGINCIITVL